MSQITLGIIGAGRIIRQGYLAVLPLVQDIEAVLLYDLDRSRAQAVIDQFDDWVQHDKFATAPADRFPGAQARAVDLRRSIALANSSDEFFRRCDVVLVATPPASHLEIAQACLDAGCIALVEKPLALSSQAAREFACRNESVLDRVRYLENYPFNPVFQRVRSLMEGGTLGTVQVVAVSLSKPLPSDPGDAWRLDARQSGGGVLSDWGSHTFGLALYLAGDGCNVESVKTESIRFLPGIDPPVETYALTSIVAETESGVPIALRLEHRWEEDDEHEDRSGFRVSVQLTHGTIHIHQKVINGNKEYRISAAGSGQTPVETAIRQDFTNDSLYYSLVESIRSASSPYTAYSFGLQILDIVKESRGCEYV